MKVNWVIRIANKFVLGLSLSSVAVIIWRWRSLPPLVPLWYSHPWGLDQLAHPALLFILPGTTIFWYAINRIISLYLIAEHLVFIQVLHMSSLLMSIMSFVAVVKILFLVT